MFECISQSVLNFCLPYPSPHSIPLEHSDGEDEEFEPGQFLADAASRAETKGDDVFALFVLTIAVQMPSLFNKGFYEINQAAENANKRMI